MRNKVTSLIIVAMATMLLTACGSIKKATGTQPQGQTGQSTTSSTVATEPIDKIIATVGDWQTLQCGGNIALMGSSSFSSSIQVRMVRDQAILFSIRPLLGIEAGKLLITADSIYAIDKIHKRLIAEKVSLLTAGIPVTVSDVQDIFLGRPFVIGKGTLCESLKPQIEASSMGSGTVLSPVDGYKGYRYAFSYNKSTHIVSLDITPQGSSTAAYQVKYNDVRSTQAGNIAHSIIVNATMQNKKLDFTLNYKNIDWNGNVKIDRNIPSGYTRMKATDLFSIFN